MPDPPENDNRLDSDTTTRTNYERRVDAQYLPGGGDDTDVTFFRPPERGRRIAVKLGLWRTLWYVIVRGRRVYVPMLVADALRADPRLPDPSHIEVRG